MASNSANSRNIRYPPTDESEKVFDNIREDIIGRDHFIDTPYGKRIITYADYVASGRVLYSIEDAILRIQRQYANTHTEDDDTGRNMGIFLTKAEQIIKKAFNAQKNCYLFPTGTGATGAILKFQQILGVYTPPATKARLEELFFEYEKSCPTVKKHIDEWKSFAYKNRPVVFISAYEHHANELMWREAFTEVVIIGLTDEGCIDLEDLERKVSDKRYHDRFKIGSFSAASNVTGLLSPVYDIARILHTHGSIACFDFAASAPYVTIDMNRDGESYFDAIFLSPHKFLGGPASSGILVMNKKLYRGDLPPTCSAGGTVDYVGLVDHDYAKDPEVREKAGTPGIIQIIRAALAISLKDQLGIGNIEERERRLTEKAFEHISKNRNIVILGNSDPNSRLPIFSFLIKHEDRYLHPKLGARLLNDLFGIQTRSGCSCAGPYGHRLLNIDADMSLRYRNIVKKGHHFLKPGWLRLNFHYAMADEECDYILRALDFVADYGYLFISEYEMDDRYGVWSKIDYDAKMPDIWERETDQDSIGENVHRNDLRSQYLKYAMDKAIELKSVPKEAYFKFEDPEIEELSFFNVKNIRTRKQT